MSDTILAQIGALKTKSTAELRQMWRELSDREPALPGRRYLEDRLAYRIQELHFGGLSDRARRKLDALADQLEPQAARRRDPGRPIAGTQLRRAWQGLEQCRHRARARLRVQRPAVQVTVGGRARDRRNEMERVVVLRSSSQRAVPMNAPPRKLRCAIYCRKSSEEGLEQTFNSLDAQRESCLNYVRSQAHEGWIAVDDTYTDPGLSGATMQRPALRRLLRDIEASKIDAVICYRIDRLTRSLRDFMHLIGIFERCQISLVSVTEHFNTGSAIGRLNLHIIMSFGQYERELAAERIRDKFAASRCKGLWMGGHAPLGYNVRDRTLVINQTEGALVHHIFERFLQVGPATKLVQELNAAGHRTKRGKPFHKGIIYKLLNNRTYVGEVEHKGAAYPGEDEAIIERDTWGKVRAILAENAHRRGSRTRAAIPALLKGLIIGPDGNAMAPSHTRRRGRLYRFYRTATSLKLCHDACPIRAVPAGEVEAAVINQIRAMLRAPEVVVRVWRAAQLDGEAIDEREVVEALQRLDPLWHQLFPAAQARILQLLVARVVVRLDGLEIILRIEGITSLIEDLRLRESTERRAA
jgi:DNA invertase Pin-like site-specific DNA recombinase